MSGLSASAKEEIRKEAGFICSIPTCYNTSPLDIHHILPISEAGTNDPDNLICLCRNCHGRFHTGEITKKALLEYKKRLMKINTILAPHHYKYLEALFHGEKVELVEEDKHLALKLEREGFVSFREMKRPKRYRLQITAKGNDFIK